MIQSQAEGKPVEKLYTADEAAAYLKVTLRTIRQWLKDGSLKGSKVGKAWLIRESDIQAFIESRVPKKGEASDGPGNES